MAPTATLPLTADEFADAQTLWDYHQMGHELRSSTVGVGLGSHDPGVAVHAADLYRRGMFPLIVFTGANSPTTEAKFPRGEAVHYREIAIDHGVPADVILIETKATNTGQNIQLTRDLLERDGIEVESAVLMSRPYQQRRAYATCRLLWPEVDIRCSSAMLPLVDYIESIGDADRVLSMLVGDTQRIHLYAHKGFAAPQPMPSEVYAAYVRLRDAGFTARLLPE